MRRRKSVFFVVSGVLSLMTASYLWTAYGAAQTASDSNSKRRIRGRVISEYGPVPGARVRVAGDEKYALTDRQGRFEIETGHHPIRNGTDSVLKTTPICRSRPPIRSGNSGKGNWLPMTQTKARDARTAT